jgi:hypothetical protein
VGVDAVGAVHEAAMGGADASNHITEELGYDLPSGSSIRNASLAAGLRLVQLVMQTKRVGLIVERGCAG